MPSNPLNRSIGLGARAKPHRLKASPLAAELEPRVEIPPSSKVCMVHGTQYAYTAVTFGPSLHDPSRERKRYRNASRLIRLVLATSRNAGARSTTLSTARLHTFGHGSSASLEA